MTGQAVAALVGQPEGQYFERKSLWKGPGDARRPRDRRQVRDEIAEYVAAFANADGGTLVMGVEDDGTPTGHGYPDEAVQNMLSAPSQRLKPAQPVGDRVSWQGHELLIFEVAGAERAVMVHGDGFPRRVHDQVFQESEEAINAIKARGRTESVEQDPAPALGLSALDSKLLERARQGAGLGDIDDADYLIERRLADLRGEELVLRKGALLLFARRARDIAHPNAGVRVFRVDGTERLTGARHNVRELPRIEGALPSVMERAYESIGALIRRSARLHDLFFREMPEYPTFAWQEALVNAIAHRDYRSHGRCVEVWLFEDRMEVTSPGALPAEVDFARLRRREPVHCSRNPRITRVLGELALMREQGEGIPRIFEEMEQSWLRLPELRADEHSFTVVLRNAPILETPDPEWVRHVRSLPVGHRQRRVLVAYPGGRFANADYQSLNDVDRDTAYRELRELVDLGLVTATGRGRGARYTVELGPVRPGEPPLTPERVLVHRMKQQGFVQNADYRDAFGVDRRSALAALTELMARDIVVRTGERRGTRYRPGPRWAAWANGTHLRGG